MCPIPSLPSRPPAAHKGTFGRVTLVGGSRGMAGSIALSAMAAMRSGTGLGHAAVPDGILETVAAFEPCVMTHPLPCDTAGCLTLAAAEELDPLLADMNAIGIGPGFSRSEDARQLARHLVRSVARPLVVDADALFGLADDLSALDNTPGPRVLTPHPGEFARLTSAAVPADDAGRRNAAETFAARYPNVVVVLKGPGTVVTDGNQTFVNTTGNVGMATAGSGDVLTGVVSSLLGQGMAPFDAAVLAVHAHGQAGDLAAETVGAMGLVASDLVKHLPAVWRNLEQ